MPASAGMTAGRRPSQDRAGVTCRPPRLRPHRTRQAGRTAMLIRRRRGWEIPESKATDEAVFRNRRRLLQGIAAGPILASGLARPALAADAATAGLYPAKRNDKYKLDRPITDEKYSTTYNNFYE